MLIQNLEYTPVKPVIIAAFVDRIKGGDTWYFNLTTDGFIGQGAIISKQYATYDEAVYGMNERIGAMYEDVSG
jgi:hypothetical protein|tara:strand:+ start:694 stop:912 length:219 start_codon:yes stop_codon:yes gene_type:complete